MNSTLTRFALRRSLLCTAACLLLPAARAGTPGPDLDPVKVYTSANFAPLMLSDGRGVYPALVAYLNAVRPGGLRFSLHYLPRRRLQVLLESGAIDGIVIGMMPEWLDDGTRQKYLWSAPFATDRYVLVSPSSRPLRPDVPASLAGAAVGVTRDYVYFGIEPWLNKSRLVRSDGVSDEKNLERVLQGRLDCAIVAESMARYFIRAHNMANKLHVGPLKATVTERRFLAPHSQRAVFEKIVPVLDKLRDDPAWKASAAVWE